MTDTPPPARQRVAVIGGGVAGLFTALALSDPRLDGRYEVTVHSRGWRLGGKCASGRNPDQHDRIEEHGLHLWFGFYENAFAWARRCLEDLPADLRAQHPSLDEAFSGLDEVVLFEEWPDHEHVQKVSALRLRFPPDPTVDPGGAGDPATVAIPTFGVTVRRVADVLAATADAMFAGAVPFGPGRLFARAVGVGARLGVRLVPRRLGAVPGARPGALTRFRLRLLRRSLGVARALALPILDPFSGRGEGRRRQLFTGLDLLHAALGGIIDDRLLEVGFGAIDGLELREWLARHGAAPQSLGSGSVLWALYDLVFGYHRGEVGVPELAAGRALLALLRLLGGYHGHFGYRMTSSMGEVVIAPMYELLRRRGVHFAFFRDLRAIHLDDDQRLTSVELHRQADIDVDAYDPFAWTGTPHRAQWPIAPDWAAIGLDPNQVSAEALENGLEPVAGEAREVLELGRDVDHVVLAVPAPVLADPALHGELARLPAWRRMLEHSASVATIAYQVWSDTDGAAPQHLNDRFGEAIVSSYDQPFSTYCPMDQLAEVERWAPGRAVRIGYGCGVWPEPVEHRLDALRPAAARGPEDVPLAAVAEEAARSIGRLGALPDPPGRGAMSLVRRRSAPPPPVEATLPPGLLDGPPAGARPAGDAPGPDAGGGAPADGPDGGQTLWVRLNDRPAHRYVTTPPVNPWFRIPPDRTGVEGLSVAGDWTANLLDGGCVEATVISALWAVRGIARRDGVAEHALAECFATAGEGTWLDHGGPTGTGDVATPAQRPAPVEPDRPEHTAWDQPSRVGALTSVPGPYASDRTTLYAWLAEVDPVRAAAVARRCFADMTGGAVRVEPMGSLAMITAGDIAAVSSLSPPYRRLGKLGERQVVVWLPCHVEWDRDAHAASSLAGASPPPDFAMFVPYLWVDNPMSLTTGREGLGWPKAMAGFEPATGISLPLSLTAYGLARFGPDAVVDPALPLLSIAAADESPLGEVVSIAEVAARITAAAAEAFGADAVEAVGAVLAALRSHGLPQLFAKSMIAASDRPEDDGLSVVTAQATVLRWRDLRLVGPCDLVVHEVASHPVAVDLGLRSQTLPIGLRVELDFRQESGTVRWSNWASPRQRVDRARALRRRRQSRRAQASGKAPRSPSRSTMWIWR